MGKISEFGQLLSDTFTGPTLYDSGPLGLGHDDRHYSDIATRLLGGRVRAVAGSVVVRVRANYIACDAAEARVIAQALLDAADAIDADKAARAMG